MKANDIIKVVCTFWSIAEYEVIYANGKARKFTEDTLPQNAKEFVIKRIGTEGHTEENVCMKIGHFIKRAIYTRV